MAVFEAEDDLELLKGLEFKTMTWADVAASQNGLSTDISQFRGKAKTERTKLAESCGVVTDSSMRIAEISFALMKAKRQGEDNINQRREYLFAKQLISAWAMKPIRSTTAMDKGKKNEPHVIRELPSFWERWAREPSCTTLEHITETGLVVSQANPMERTRGMEATSVDGVGVRKFRNGDVEPLHLIKLCRMGNGFQKFDSYTLWRHHCSTTQTFKEFQIQVITKSGILGCPNPTKIVSLARAHDYSQTSGPTTRASQNRATSHTGQARMEGETVTENKFRPPRAETRKRKHFADPNHDFYKLRLDKNEENFAIKVIPLRKKAKSNHCQLCTVNILKTNGFGNKVIDSRKGPRVVSQCKACGVHLCRQQNGTNSKSCFEKWHTQQTLRIPVNKEVTPRK